MKKPEKEVKEKVKTSKPEVKPEKEVKEVEKPKKSPKKRIVESKTPQMNGKVRVVFKGNKFNSVDISHPEADKHEIGKEYLPNK